MKCCKHVLFIGLFDKDTKKQEIGTLTARDLVINILLQNDVGGGTICDARGFYKHEDGTRVVEPSLKVEIDGEIQEKTIKTIIADIKFALNQECVNYNKIYCDQAFI